MITILVKEPEVNIKEDRTKNLKHENAILKAAFIESIRKQEEYKDLLKKGLRLIDKQQEEIEALRLKADLWADEVVKQYYSTGDFKKALESTGHEIMMYELSRIRKNCGEED